jgi:hypothetical protein
MGDSACAGRTVENQTDRSKVKILQESVLRCFISAKKKANPPERVGLVE